MVNNREEGKSRDSKATKPTQEELLLSQCFLSFVWQSQPLCLQDAMGHPQHPPAQVCPCRECSPCRHGIHAGEQSLQAWSPCRNSVHLCSSLGPAAEEDQTLLLSQVCVTNISRREEQSPWPSSESPLAELKAFPWAVAASPPQPGLKLGLPKTCFPPASACSRAKSCLTGNSGAASCDEEFTGVGGKSAPSHLCWSSPPTAMHPPRRMRVGLFGFCGFSIFPPLNQLREMKMLSLLQHCLCSLVSSSPAPWGSLLGLGTRACGLPTRHRQSCLGILAMASSHFWVKSHCLSASQACRLRAGSGSSFHLLPLHCNLSGGAILQMLEEAIALFQNGLTFIMNNADY